MLKAHKVRRRASITPLIDIIFLLLLFFMLASTFNRYSELELASASKPMTPATSQSKAETLVLQVMANEVKLANEKMSLDQAIELIAAGIQIVPAPKLAVVPTVETTTQRLVDVMGRLKAIDGLNMQIIRGQQP